MNKYTQLGGADQSSSSIPQFVDCGMILMKNLHLDDLIHESEAEDDAGLNLKQNNSKLNP